MADGKEYTIGIVEYTDDWSPFHPAPFDKVEVNSDEEGNDTDEGDDVDEEDGISDTWMGQDDNDIEDGEIPPEKCTEPVISSEISSSPEICPSPAVSSTPVTEINAVVYSCNNDTTIPENTATIEILESSTAGGLHQETHDTVVLELINNGGTIVQKTTTQLNKLGNDCNPFGSSQNMVQFGCFGPFPNPFLPHHPTSAQKVGSNSRLGPDSGKPKIKKRKRNSNCSKSQSPLFTFKSLEPQIDTPPPPTDNGIGEIDIGVPSSLDLNRNLNINTSDCDDIRADCSSSCADEIIQTVEIGAEIGFQIEAGNPILAEIAGDTEAIHGCQ
ncbi:unnamed protein product [Lactuca virosa]|uniref:Uncharacterized protein n=1 Tax=Lactuca virosa TaxID=75947 RepID=A0AAU9PQ55_9ASTR|nr:unnamed protein product [Lactuca virosa]